MQKRISLYLLLTLFLVSIASASVLDEIEAFKNNLGITEPLIILSLRLAVLLLVAFLLYEGLSHVGLSLGAAGVVSFIIALMSAVFIPGGVLEGIASTYAVLVSVILIILPLAALMIIIYVFIPGTSLGWRVLRIALITLVLILLYLFKSWISYLNAGAAGSVAETLKSAADKYFWFVILGVVLLLVIEIMRARSFQRQKGAVGKIEEKMETEGLSEKGAEKEIKEEKKAKKKDERVFKSAIGEYTLLKRLRDEIKDATEDKTLLGEAGGKLKKFKREKSIEKKMTRRLKKLTADAEKVMKSEPSKKPQIEKALAELNGYNKQLIALMSKGGQFEQVLNTKVSASLTLADKKANLLGILERAIKLDEAVIAASQNLGEILK